MSDRVSLFCLVFYWIYKNTVSERWLASQRFCEIRFLIRKCFIYFIFHAIEECFFLGIWADFRAICVNFWRIEKLCSLTNCISPHLARPHMQHEYLIMVCWMWVPHPSVCAYVGYSLMCVASSEALSIFMSTADSSSLSMYVQWSTLVYLLTTLYM